MLAPLNNKRTQTPPPNTLAESHMAASKQVNRHAPPHNTRPRFTSFFPAPPLRKTNELRIPRPAIRPNIVLPEPVLHVESPRLVEPDSAPLHDGLDLALALLIEALTAIAGFDVGGQVEGGAAEAGFDVVAEGGREACVEVGEVGNPARAGVVENWRGVSLGGRRGEGKRLYRLRR